MIELSQFQANAIFEEMPKQVELRDRLARHLRSILPDQTSKLDASQIDKVLRDTLRIARAIGVSSDAAMASWAEISIHFGSDFSTKCTWAARILEERALPVKTMDAGNDLVTQLYGAATRQLITKALHHA